MSINKLFVKTIVLAIVLLGAVQSKAQLFSLGIKGGVSTSNLFTPPSPTMGMTAGLMGELKFVNWLRLRTEANVLWNGQNKHFWEQEDTDYFAVGLPVMLQFMPFKNFHIGAGAELDYLVATQGGEMPDNRLNFGLLAHVEYRFFDRLGLGVRYVHNLGNFSNFQQFGEAVGAGNTPTNAFPASSVQVTLSYRFGKNGK